MFQKSLFASIITIALAFTLTAADEKKADEKKSTGSKSSGMLQPAMIPEGGWDKAMGTLGEKGEAWSATTVGASVNGKPVSGKSATVTGEIIDLSCYLQLGKHGEKHNGQPIGLLAKDGTIYMLMDEEHDPRRDGQTELRKAANDHFAHVMEVTGTETTVRGVHAIYVQGFVKK